MGFLRSKKFIGSGVVDGANPPSDTDSFWMDNGVLKYYDESTDTWKESGGGSTTTSSNQVTKLGVTASSTSPKEINITIPSTTDFNLPPIEILKFVTGTTNNVTTQSAFNNADSTDFEANNYVIFDGTMHLKNIYSQSMTDNGGLGSGKTFTGSVDINEFSDVEKIEII